MRGRSWRVLGSAVLAGALTAGVLAAPPASAVGGSFFTYSGSTPLSKYKPGAVLATRTVSYSLEGIPLPLSVTQVLYRTTNARGQAIANVTSVLRSPTAPASESKVIAYQSFYDSLNPEDSPSRAVSGGTSSGAGAVHAETALISPFLLQGYDVVVTDTEGPTADFADGPEYGMTTLDAVRAVTHTKATGIATTAKVGMVGYSGGAIATAWAAALAPSYAPDVNKQLVGAAEGGVLVDPDHNLHYIQGSLVWAGVLVMALIGVSRSYAVDLTPYLNSYGVSVYAKLKTAPIASVLGEYPGLTWAQIAKPQYATPESIPLFVSVINKINLGSAASPTVPMFIGQGANGLLEGTNGSQAGIGAGDGVMVAGDVRSLARKYCASGDKVTFTEYDLTSHFTTVPLWMPSAYSWLGDRFSGKAAPSNCSTIAAGNPLTPVPTPKG